MALRFASILIFTICAVGLGVAIPAPPPTGNCGQNAERRSCGTACPATCRNPNPSICVLPCVDGCFCRPGYLKAANGECIRPEQCDNVPHIPMQIPQANLMAEEAKSEEPKCGADEEYRTCGPSCTPTCAMPFPKPWCSLRCFSGCYCKEGYLKNEEGKCIPATKCKLPEGMSLESIPLHRVTLKPQASGPIHIPLYKDITKPKASGPVSIPLQKVPLTPHCPNENEEFHACGVQMDCLASCKPPTSPKCMERKCTPGCVCREPFVRHEDGRCVEKNQCPKAIPFAQA